MNSTHAQAYAQLLLKTGLHFEQGQCLLINAEAIHAPLCNAIAAEAYRMGAKFVQVEATHPGLLAARVQHSSEEYLSFLPEFERARAEEMAKESWAKLRISGQEDPALLENLPGAKLGILQRTARQFARPLLRAAMADELSWCVAAAPTPAWGQQVFPDAPAADASDLLWQAMHKILRLDQDDPSATWAQLALVLQQRCERLNSLNLHSLHFQSASTGTNLQVGLHRGGRWLGGGTTFPDGRPFMPNLPTEEVFTTPDYRRVEGTMVVTRPVDVLNKEVVGARFEFRDGAVVDFDASEGKDALGELLKLDNQARFAGEIALVDHSSPIYQSGLTFHNILYDENASCHLALGSAYPRAIPGAEKLSQKERLEKGINESIAHTDFMIGSDDLLVTGVDAQGKSIPLLEAGQFVL